MSFFSRCEMKYNHGIGNANAYPGVIFVMAHQSSTKNGEARRKK